MWARTIFGALTLCVLAATSCGADSLVNEPGRWSPWKFRAEPFTRKLYAASGADLSALDAQLRVLDAIIRRASAVAQPVGFSCQTWGHLSEYAAIAPGQPKGSEMPLGSGLTFGAFPIFEYQRNGRTVRDDGGETELMNFIVNDIQPQSSGTVVGFPRYGNFIVITKRKEPIWVPVSLEGALRLTIAAEQKRLDYLKETRGPAKAIRACEDKVATIESHIAALPLSQRSAPSCLSSRGSSWEQRFQAGASSECTPLMRPNWAFFDRRLPRSVPQVLLVTDIARCYEGKQSITPGGCTTNRKLLESLDQQALMDWLH